MKKLTILFIIIDTIVASCFMLFYSPFFKDFQNKLISTSISTMTHDYIAYTFYSKERVKSVVQADTIIPFKEDTDLDKIVIDTKPRDVYENEYDKEILDRDENAKYKLINLKIRKHNAYLVAIYDPSKIKLLTSPKFNTGNNSGDERLLNMAQRLNSIVAINSGGFRDPDGWGSDIPMGYVIKDSKIIWQDNNKKANLIGFTNDNKLLLTNATGEEALEKGMRDAIQFGPFLMVNGEKMKYPTKVGGYSEAARTAIAQRRDGIVLLFVTEGWHLDGVTMNEVVDILEKYGAYNAANLDGGTSAQLVINNKLVNTPRNIYNDIVKNGRPIVTAFGLIDD